MTITTNDEMNKKLVEMLRVGEFPSQYAAQRIVELEIEVKEQAERIKTLESIAGACDTYMP